METARFTRKSKRRRRLLADLVALFDWSAYQYVLLPVSGRNHYRVLVIENPMHPGPTKVYHVNSVKNAHSSAYAFDVLQWWSTFVHLTKPQQSNCIDCGVYVLHYMDVISKHIAAEKPGSIEVKIAAWTGGDFGVKKAAAYRAKLYRTISPA
ncbi:hypothetical protein PHYSODRAFT_500299 [Phytophthora sojae]|uniref:Ubiquitin-like protease family profile domain-containing protein n=1 Tax=Phytophthora sojae (strain P6497) TaxID=1094619 RepID=G4ZDG2_PHYSP|nr:hypothetical protein PHYSODRAFT_500299 [Phytophthora sojae]EGZ17812.1 hypothetical protein PHYSODRAFT_500299 [Phytophthora sojae]|eukprot:XP_009526870.1 hypothetical protein PHYSODRAFT_500299 [Phytophthora sojae]